MLSKQSKCLYKVALVYSSEDFVAQVFFLTLYGIKFNPRIYGLQYNLITCELNSLPRPWERKVNFRQLLFPYSLARSHTGTTMEPWMACEPKIPMIFEWILQIIGSAIYGPQIPSFNSVAVALAGGFASQDLTDDLLHCCPPVQVCYKYTNVNTIRSRIELRGLCFVNECRSRAHTKGPAFLSSVPFWPVIQFILRVQVLFHFDFNPSHHSKGREGVWTMDDLADREGYKCRSRWVRTIQNTEQEEKDTTISPLLMCVIEKEISNIRKAKSLLDHDGRWPPLGWHCPGRSRINWKWSPAWDLSTTLWAREWWTGKQFNTSDSGHFRCLRNSFVQDR